VQLPSTFACFLVVSLHSILCRPSRHRIFRFRLVGDIRLRQPGRPLKSLSAIHWTADFYAWVGLVDTPRLCTWTFGTSGLRIPALMNTQSSAQFSSSGTLGQHSYCVNISTAVGNAKRCPRQAGRAAPGPRYSASSSRACQRRLGKGQRRVAALNRRR